jgi:PilZ domain
MRPNFVMASFDPAHWSTWAVALGIGLVSGGFVFLVGRWVMLARRKAAFEQYDYDPDADPDPIPDNPAGVMEEVDPYSSGAGGGTMDRRQALRRGGNPISVLVNDAECQGHAIKGYVLDRSTGGLCISLSAEIPAGTVLSVRTTNSHATIPWVQVEVRNCRSVGKEWELGCKFVSTPPWSVLLLFG